MGYLPSPQERSVIMCTCQMPCLCEVLEEPEGISGSRCPRCMHKPYCVYIEAYYGEVGLRLSEVDYAGLQLRLQGLCEEFMPGCS